jgi:hypothetical protein
LNELLAVHVVAGVLAARNLVEVKVVPQPVVTVGIQVVGEHPVRKARFFKNNLSEKKFKKKNNFVNKLLHFEPKTPNVLRKY